MHKLLRYYNQNRRQIWITVIIIFFVIFIIQLLNNVAKKQNEKDIQQNNQNQETTYKNVVSYDKESQTIISGANVAGEKKIKFGKIIDEFFTYCINHNPEKAYELLSEDIKNNIFESESLFESLYYIPKFEGNKQYSFQSWSTSNNKYTYQVKIFDDMLSTGKKDNKYIEDYITVVKENDEYKLNIDGYIGKEEINAIAKNKNISIKITNVYFYKDYEVFDFVIKNNTNNRILLDTKENTKTIYLTDGNDNKFNALLYENNEQDLLLEANQTKKIQIKFNFITYDDFKIKSINFTDIILNYEQYELDKTNKKLDSIEIKF